MTDRYVLGIDIGGTTVKLGLFKEEQLLARSEIPTRTERAGEQLLPDILAACGELLATNAIDWETVSGIGLTVPGAVREQRYVEVCANLNGWGGFDVAEAFAGLLGEQTGKNIPVRVVNDANAAALGEAWQGAGRDYPSIVMVTLGTGIGGGIVLNGSLLEGVHGCGGEIGHIKICPSETDVCGCGGRGCAEQYSSATGLVRMARKILNGEAVFDRAADEVPLPSALRDMEEYTAKDVLDLAKEGDTGADTAVGVFACALGTLLANLSATVDPNVFLIGGGVSNAGSWLIDRVRPEYEKRAFPATRRTPILLALLKNDAGIYGAAKLML